MKTQNAKHTPGPWEVIAYDGGFEIGPRRTNEFSSKEPAPTWIQHCAFVQPGRYQRKEEVDANARLIATAPELLAALKNLASVSPCWDHECPNPDCAVNIARAAIAKATGQEG